MTSTTKGEKAEIVFFDDETGERRIPVSYADLEVRALAAPFAEIHETGAKALDVPPTTREAIRSYLAASIAKPLAPLTKEAREARQLAKAVNFGAPGGVRPLVATGRMSFSGFPKDEPEPAPRVETCPTCGTEVFVRFEKTTKASFFGETVSWKPVRVLHEAACGRICVAGELPPGARSSKTHGLFCAKCRAPEVRRLRRERKKARKRARKLAAASRSKGRRR